MYVSIETVSVIATVIIAGGTLARGVYVMLRRMEDRQDLKFAAIDARFEKSESSVNARFEKLETSIDARFENVDKQFREIHEELREVRSDIGRLEVAVARIEGPSPQLLTARG